MEALYDIRENVKKYWKGLAVALIIVLIAILAIIFQLELSDLRLRAQLDQEAMSNQIHSDVVAHLNKAMEGDYFSSLLGGLTNAELDDLASRVSSIVGDKVTMEVLLGTEKLVVQDLTDDIQKMIAERFNSWTQDERKAFSDQIASIVLKDIESYLDKQITGTDSGQFGDLYEIVRQLQGGNSLADSNLKDIQAAQTKEIAALQAQDRVHTSDIDTLKTEVNKTAGVNDSITTINNNIQTINNDLYNLNNIVNGLPEMEEGMRTTITNNITKLERELTEIVNNNETITRERISEAINELNKAKEDIEKANKGTQDDIKDAMNIINNITNQLNQIDEYVANTLNNLNSTIQNEVSSRMPRYSVSSEYSEVLGAEQPKLTVTLPQE